MTKIYLYNSPKYKKNVSYYLKKNNVLEYKDFDNKIATSHFKLHELRNRNIKEIIKYED